MEKKNNQIESWPDLAIGLYDKLTGRNAAITYDFDNFQLDVPSKVGSGDTTLWKMNGKLTITTASDSTAG
jgi:hypothetical protein